METKNELITVSSTISRFSSPLPQTPPTMNLSLPAANGRHCLRSSSDPFRPRGRQFGIRQRSPKLISSSKKWSLNNLKVLSCHKQDVPVLEARSIGEIYDALAERLVSAAEKANDLNSKYIVGLAGPPGAGKTTVASEVVHRLNTAISQKMLTQLDEVAVVLPMDGFHLYRSQLDAMENPQEAHARRGAPWTFNPVLLLKCLHAVRSQGTVRAPSFDHGVGDPVEDDVLISIQHKVVIVEGNYLFLEDGVWKEVCEVFDEKWFLDININTAMQRVLKRHIATGKEPDVAKWRIEYNDRPNAELIMESKKHADLLIRSVDF